MTTYEIRAIVFDVQGTLVDFYSTFVKYGTSINLKLDWSDFLKDWRQEYREGLNKIISKETSWLTTDEIYRKGLDKLLSEPKYQWLNSRLNIDDRAELCAVWYRLEPWPDTGRTLGQLQSQYILSTLSNGSMASIIRMMKSANLKFDCILTSDLVHSSKPDPKVYNLASESLGLAPSEILLVACHTYDLKAAARLGFRTAYIYRPHEFGPDTVSKEAEEFDLNISNLNDLTHLLRS